MRNFEERKAEVFRRSENRIKERKRNRKRILTLCIPLCLIVMVWSAAILPAMHSKGEANDASMEMVGGLNGQESTSGADNESNDSVYGDIASGIASSSAEESQTHKFVSVSVKGPEYSGEITNDSGVTAVFHSIHDIWDVNGGYKDMIGESSQEDQADKDDEKVYSTDTTKNQNSYVITLTSIDGTERVYILCESVLYDVSFDREITLTNGQLNDLLVALELADY